MKYLLFPILLLLLFACEKANDTPKTEGCDVAIRAQLDYVFSDGNIDFSGFECIGFLNKYRAEGGNFFYVPDCNCCDMALRVYNCAGEDTCDEDGLCPGFADLELIGIIGIKE